VKVISRPPTPHYCRPGWVVRHHQADPADPFPRPTGDYLHDLGLPAGSVVECDCGRVWVAHPMLPGEWPGLVTGRIYWRHETRRERRRRLRRCA
jgi:hypothetical protein